MTYKLSEEFLSSDYLSEELTSAKKRKERRVRTRGQIKSVVRNKRKIYNDKYRRKNKSKIKRRRRELNRKPIYRSTKSTGGGFKRRSSSYDSLTILQVLLAMLRASHWSHWTSHWQVKGKSYYSDHELMERIYNSLVEEIDTLAEKIVSNYGSEAVETVEQAKIMTNHLLPLMEAKAENDPIKRALIVEESLQMVLKKFYNMLKNLDCMSLGMDDFIMSIANAHETNLYLLRQRLS